MKKNTPRSLHKAAARRASSPATKRKDTNAPDPPKRKPLSERVPKGATIRRQYVQCGKPNCAKWHGPYWYAFWRVNPSRTASAYIGRDAKLAELLKEHEHIHGARPSVNHAEPAEPMYAGMTRARGAMHRPVSTRLYSAETRARDAHHEIKALLKGGAIHWRQPSGRAGRTVLVGRDRRGKKHTIERWGRDSFYWRCTTAGCTTRTLDEARRRAEDHVTRLGR